jgi:hypothetical protein
MIRRAVSVLCMAMMAMQKDPTIHGCNEAELPTRLGAAHSIYILPTYSKCALWHVNGTHSVLLQIGHVGPWPVGTKALSC